MSRVCPGRATDASLYDRQTMEHLSSRLRSHLTRSSDGSTTDLTLERSSQVSLLAIVNSSTPRTRCLLRNNFTIFSYIQERSFGHSRQDLPGQFDSSHVRRTRRSLHPSHGRTCQNRSTFLRLLVRYAEASSRRNGSERYRGNDAVSSSCLVHPSSFASVLAAC